ncbi:tubulin epsilon and delta complex protein 2 [Erethizon dorsatum]
MAVMLRADCASRLVAELQGALDACAERQRQLEQSLRVSRRLLQAWEAGGTTVLEPSPGSETKKEASSPACAPNPQDLKELELLTQALEKAIRVRKGISKTGERGRTPSLKSGSIAMSPGTTASALPQSLSRARHCSLRTRPAKGIHQATVPAKDRPEHRLPLVRDTSHVGRGAQATRLEPNHGEQMTLSAAPHAAETFTLKEKGTLLQLPMAFRKAASQNSCLWTQLSSTQTNDGTDATSAAKTQFLQKMQMSSSISSSRFSAMEVEMEAQCLQKACALLRQRMEEELSAAPVDWMQEYRCLLTLEGLQAMAGQCLHKVQELCTGIESRAFCMLALTEQLPGPCLMGRPLQASLPCGGRVCTSWGPQLLLYSSTQELQTLAALRLRVAMLEQQVHLQKVLMAELLPIVSTQEPKDQPWLALCRAAHSLLCEGGERFLTILQEDPAD